MTKVQLTTAACIGLVLLSSAWGQGTVFTYQGQLEQANQPAEGAFDFQFALFDTDDFLETTPFAGPINNLAQPVTAGLFVAELDFGSGVFGTQDLWLEIRVRESGSPGSFTTLSPRQRVAAVPLSLTSLEAITAVEAQLANDVAAGSVGADDIDVDAVQRRIPGACSPESAIRQINSDGTVVCETDDNTTYQPGPGLSINGDTISVDEFENLARKDAAAGNQYFNTRTLVLDYPNHSVGVNLTAPDETLDVGGNIEFTGQLLPSANRTFYSYVPPSEFESSSSSLVNAGLYLYPSSNLTFSGYARPKIPNGAIVRTVTCYVYDSGAGSIENFNFYFYRRPYATATGTLVASDINTNLNYQDTTVRGFSITGLSETVDHSRNDYYLLLNFDLPSSVTSGFSAYRFYGCRLVYSVDRFSTF